MANPFDQISFNVTNQDKSLKWLQSQISKLGSITPNRLLSSQTNVVTRTIPGEMYFFIYDPKMKESLPFYDTFPLVIPFRVVEDGFYGFNLHYMPYMMRFKMLKQLHSYATNEKMDKTTRLRINWKLVSAAAKFKPLQLCVKHYLFDHLQSRMTKVDYPDWVVASQLPVERFKKANKTTVWSHTQGKL